MPGCLDLRSLLLKERARGLQLSRRTYLAYSVFRCDALAQHNIKKRKEKESRNKYCHLSYASNVSVLLHTSQNESTFSTLWVCQQLYFARKGL